MQSDPCELSEAGREQIDKVPGSNAPDKIKKVVPPDHVFVDNVRFLSMAAVVGLHTASGFYVALQPAAISDLALLECELLKFGTIGFFLVSGFLLGDRINNCSPVTYFLRRLQNVFIPWCVWFSLWCCLKFVSDWTTGRVPELSLGYAISFVGECLTLTAYWFVPNLLIALAILLVFRRFLNHLWVGALFLLASLFYGFNIYGRWIPEGHTKAVFGFVFYLWLGAWSAWHFPVIENWLKKMHPLVLIGLSLLASGLALGESKLIATLNSSDPYNTLRISNQIYSVLVVLAIMKLKNKVWPSFVDVRSHTYGLYLTHTSVRALLFAPLKPALRHLGQGPEWLVWSTSLVLLPIIYVAVYGACLLLIRALLANPSLWWTVGLRLRRESARAAEVAKKAVRQSPKQLGREEIPLSIR